MSELYDCDLRHFWLDFSPSFPPSSLRHGGGGGDLHRQGAAERHEHLQPQAQGTVAERFFFFFL